MFNSELIQNITVSAAAIVPIIVAICQAFKMTGWVKEQYTPFLSVGVGIVISILLANDFKADVSNTIFTGIIFGLSASGLYSGVKVTSHAIKMNRMKENKKDNDNF